jgi:outer membrane protein assembly factor BamB
MRHILQLASVHDDLKSTPTVLGEKALLGTLDGYLHTVDLESGMASRYNIGPSLSPIRTDIVVFQSYAVVCRRSGEISAFSLDFSTLLWHHQPSSPTPIFSSPLAIGGIVFVVNVKGSLEARLVSNGSLVWSFEAPSLVFASLISFKLDDSDILCLGCDDGHLICLRAVDGSVLWRNHLNGRLFASPCLLDISSGDTCLCATTTNGTVHLLSNIDGSSLADPFEVNGETFCSPVGWNNSLVMGFRDDHLYCFRYS